MSQQRDFNTPEMYVIGCMLTNADQLATACGELSESDFCDPRHKILFTALKRRFDAHEHVDPHLIFLDLHQQKTHDQAGGLLHIMNLSQLVGVGAHIESYIQFIKENIQAQNLEVALRDLHQELTSTPQDIEVFAQQAQKRIVDVTQNKLSRAGVSLRELIDGKNSYMEALQERRNRFSSRDPYGNLDGIVNTNYFDLDKIITGMGNSNLIILAARPAMGKTALAINIAENVCFQSGKKVGVFSLEMSSDQIIGRIICSQTGISSARLQTGDLSEQDMANIYRVIGQIQADNLIIDDDSSVSIGSIRSRALRMKREHNIDLLIIDYMQLISGSGSHRGLESRQNEISEISRSLKVLAKELNLPILCLSQLSRKVEERQDKRPLLSDLRESGSIEQDADVVLFLLRNEYYDPSNQPGLAEVIVAKNRHGSIGNVTLYFQKERSRFENYTPDRPYHEEAD